MISCAKCLLTCIYSRKGPLCNKMFHCCTVHGSALPSENLMHSRESVSRPTDGKVWLTLIGWNLTAWYPTQSAISQFFSLFSQGAWNGRNGCTNGDLYTSGTHTVYHMQWVSQVLLLEIKWPEFGSLELLYLVLRWRDWSCAPYMSVFLAILKRLL